MDSIQELKRLKKIQDAWLTLRRMCNRCGHTWMLRTFAEPKVCPKCKSPYWNQKRRSDTVEEA